MSPNSQVSVRFYPPPEDMRRYFTTFYVTDFHPAEDFPAEVFPPEEIAREQKLRGELQRKVAKR